MKVEKNDSLRREKITPNKILMPLYIFNTSILEGIYLCSKVTTLRCYCILFLTKQFLACFHILVVTTGIIYHMHRNVLQIVSNSQSSFLIATKFKHALPLPHGHPHPQTKLFHTRFYPKFLNIS